MIFIKDDLFGYLPNWSTIPLVKYSMNTVISETRKLKEQRKPLLDTLKRKITLSYLFQNTDNTIIENFFKYYRTGGFYIPCYWEPIFITTAGDLTGKLNLTTANTEYFYNYQNLTTKIMLYDLAKNIQVEKLTISAITNTDIDFTTNIINGFDGLQTVLFPLIWCNLESKNIINVTDNVKTFVFDFTELF